MLLNHGKFSYFSLLIMLLLIGELIVQFSHDKLISEKQNNILDAVEEIKNEVYDVSQRAVLTSEILANYITDSGNYKISDDDFDKVSANIIRKYPQIASLSIAPDGIVKKIYPLIDNEKAINHNLLVDEKRRNGAKYALEQDHIIMIGPVKLIQNCKDAFIVRRVIFNPDSTFWGFANSIFYTDEIKCIISNILRKKGVYNYTLQGFNPDVNTDQAMVISSGNLKSNYHEFNVKIFDYDWSLKVSVSHNIFVTRFFVYSIMLIFYMAYIAYAQKLNLKQKEIRVLNELLYEQSMTDSLTMLPNRRWFDCSIDSLVYHTGISHCIAILDIDYFKSINDKYGHLTGDDALRHFCSLARQEIREKDLLIRWGGEEFLLLMVNTKINEAVDICERIRKIIEDSTLNYYGNYINFTVSIGVTDFNNITKIDDVIREADMALYKAKNSGRNQCFVYEPIL
ncbi:sensor domain-containing diguanylate cyclase [Photobacterium nomapromontoriensis]|uniref:sensor domain-containing diguanylate cyclase n=1 Tax=Photobacterium nomapromontoriensis TaxID=2910237 RepID=UPI003D1440B3